MRVVAPAWALSRLLLWTFVMVGHFKAQSLPPSTEAMGSWEGVPSFWLNPWTLFDSRFYIAIAEHGYTAHTTAFYPLYPLLLRLLGGPGASANTFAVAGILVSNLAFAGALWLLFRLTRDEWGESVARRAVWIQAFFPTAAFGAAVYTESLFLLLSLAFFFFARRRAWPVCALAGFAAGLARNSGPILFLALLFERSGEPLWRRDTWRRAACALAPLGAALLLQAFFRARFGAAANTLAVQGEFGRELTWPWLPLGRDLWSLLSKPDTWRDFVTFPQVASCLLTLALLWVYRRQFSPGKLLFVGLVLLSSLSLAWKSEPHTNSTLRFLFGTFPVAQLLALASVQTLPTRRLTLYAATLGFGLFFVFSYLFGLKDFLG